MVETSHPQHRNFRGNPFLSTLPETNIAHENLIFPGKYHQNGGFSMAMLVYRSVHTNGSVGICSSKFPVCLPLPPHAEFRQPAPMHLTTNHRHLLSACGSVNIISYTSDLPLTQQQSPPGVLYFLVRNPYKPLFATVAGWKR